MGAASEMSPNPTPLLPRTLRLQDRMRRVIMKLPPTADFLSEMAGMREWLDKHRCAPSMFKYHVEQESVIIEVEFKEKEEAEIFKQYFDRANDLDFSRCSGERAGVGRARGQPTERRDRAQGNPYD
jgi:hypothetical protein